MSDAVKSLARAARVLLAPLFVLLLIAAVSPVWSQGPPDEPPRRHHQGPPDLDEVIADLTEQLGLTDEQVPRVRAILEHQRQEMHVMRQEIGRPRDRADRELMSQRSREIRQTADRLLAEILDEDQFTRLMEIRRNRGHRRPYGPPPPPDDN